MTKFNKNDWKICDTVKVLSNVSDELKHLIGEVGVIGAVEDNGFIVLKMLNVTPDGWVLPYNCLEKIYECAFCDKELNKDEVIITLEGNYICNECQKSMDEF